MNEQLQRNCNLWQLYTRCSHNIWFWKY